MNESESSKVRANNLRQMDQHDSTAHEAIDRLSIIAHRAPVLIRVSDDDGKCTFVNQQWLDFTGRPPEQELGNGWMDGVHPDDIPAYRETFQAAVNRQHPYTMEYRLRHAGTDYRWVLETGVPWQKTDHTIDGYVSSTIDISLRKEEECRMQQAYTELKRLCDEQTDKLTKISESQQQWIIQRERAEQILQQVSGGTTSTIGPAFFRSLVEHVAAAFESRYAFVAELRERGSRVRTLAFWTPDGIIPNTEYDIAHTPCERILNGKVCHFPENVSSHFPHDRHLDELQVESYLAIPITDPSEKVIGHLAILDHNPISIQPHSLPVLKIFAARAAAELQRQSAETAIRAVKEQLEHIMASAMDGIITVDEHQMVTVFNQAAESMFQCSEKDAIGYSLARFIPERFRLVLQEYIQRTDASHEPQTPVPQLPILYGLRGDGKEIPLEASLSQVNVGGKRLFTIILRDLTERYRAKATINKLQQTRKYLQEEINTELKFQNMVGQSLAMKKIFKLVQSVAPTDTLTLVTGETGTGKELLTRAIHNLSHRKKEMFIKVNCAAIPAGLIESELFGHEKGAFTGAISRHIGRFELAHKGTLFLDEIGELPLTLQGKLLHVLEAGAFERVGGTRTIKANVRVIAATNRVLAHAVQQGQFRQDLFYRLNVFTLHIPPLRDRKEDIPLLAEFFLQIYNTKLGKSITKIPESVMASLSAYHWPGNVRELEHVIERAVLISEGTDLANVEGLHSSVETANPGLFPTLEDIEREHILKALHVTNWRISGPKGAAKLLGLKRTTLDSKIDKLGIQKDS
ncbi:MAG: sigma 54-interacting transcriptional regulator [Nitrospirales bacterium]|nr:sigma 54-interacting transcriptional regulator [Nitrospira sp.]MDR4502743.1 sigma 54-interacting transcriptional regulator [Nitrospirales bacterium]